jgi:hypothetical protein
LFVFIVFGELTKKLVTALPHDPICVNLFVYTSAVDFKPTFSEHCFSKVSEISVGTLAAVGPMLSITGSNVDVSTPFANEYLGSTQHYTNAAGETFTFSSSSPNI